MNITSFLNVAIQKKLECAAERCSEACAFLVSVFLLLISLSCLQTAGLNALSALLLICHCLTSTFCLYLGIKRKTMKLSSFPKYLFLLFNIAAFAILIRAAIDGRLYLLDTCTAILVVVLYVCVTASMVCIIVHFMLIFINRRPKPSWTVIVLVSLSAAISFGLNIECLNAWPQYDSYVYANELYKKGILSIIEPGGLMLCGHISDSYAIAGLLIRLAVPRLSLDPLYASLNSLYLLNMLTMFFSMILVYKTLRILIKGRSNLFYYCAILLFGVSPLLLGTSFMLFPDKMLLFGTVLYVYSRFAEDDGLHLLALFILCTSKETGFVIVLACSALEVLLTVSICLREGRVNERCKHSFFYYLLALVTLAVLMARYLDSSWFNGDAASSMWSGVQSLDGKQWNSFALSCIQAICVIKATFLTNFTWLLLGFQIIGVVCAIVSTRRMPSLASTIKEAVPSYVYILVLGLSYLGALCLFITGVRWRYIMPTVFAAYLLAICALDYVIIVFKGRELISNAISGCLALVLLAQSYITIDPVMLRSFSCISTGDMHIVSLDQNCDFLYSLSPSPSTEYNRQVGTFAIALDRAIASYTDPEKEQLLVFSNEYPLSAYSAGFVGIWGQGYEHLNPPRWAHWDEAIKRRVLSLDENGAMEVAFVGVESEVQDVKDAYEETYFIRVPWGDLVDGLEYKRMVGTAEYMGWKLEVYSCS